MTVLREGDQAKTQRQHNSGVLRDYGLHHRVTMKWYPTDIPRSEALPFWFSIDHAQVVLDWRELMDLGRAEFFTKYGENAKPRRLANFEGNRVELSLVGLNKEAERDGIFILKLDNLEVIGDWEEYQRYGRFI